MSTYRPPNPQEASKKNFLPLLLGATLAIGLLLGYQFRGSYYTPPPNPSYDADSSNKEVKKKIDFSNWYDQGHYYSKEEVVYQVLSFVERKYVDDVETGHLTDVAIEAILEGLDPHSTYISPEELEEVNQDMEGNFDGIGIEFFIVQDTVMVAAVVPNSPSEAVGLQAGDKIIYVGDSLLTNRNITAKDVTRFLKGERGSQVSIRIKRPNIPKLLTFKIERNTIPIFSVDAAYKLNTKTGYIRINRFSATTKDEFAEALETIGKDDIKNLIIDVRQNPGGYLSAATDILDMLFDEKKLLVYTQGRMYQNSEYESSGMSPLKPYKLAVLIDENSASASEILAGAIQDHDRGFIVGRRSFGKGLVQEQYGLSNGGALRLTVARYYIPSNRSIQKPYTEGKSDEYKAETYHRLQSGELTSENQPPQKKDSTVYYTAGGRKVYGGGGISPDFFVPLAPVFRDANFVELFGYLNSFAVSYVNYSPNAFANHRTVSDWVNNYQVSDAVFDKFIKFAKKTGYKGTLNIAPAVKKELVFQLKAAMAHYKFGNEALYQALNAKDPVVLKALSIIEKPVLK